MDRKMIVGILAATLAICAIAFGTSKMAPPGSPPSPPPAPTSPSAPTETLPAFDPHDFRVGGRFRLGPPALRYSPSRPSQPAPTPPAQPPAQSCSKPSLYFVDVDIGRATGSGIIATFITNTKDTCKVKLKVGYTNRSSNPCLITNASWNVTMSHGFTVSGTPKTSTEGSGFHKQFVYEATFTDSTNDRGTCNQKYPGRYDGGKGKPISLTATFTGTYSGGTATLGPRTIAQDEIDGIRQEHVDYGQKVVPSRGHFVSGTPRDRIYNWGHYNYLINKDLADKRLAWAKYCKPSWTATNLLLTSGYRHPYHNFAHAGAKIKNLHGLHQYGLALDAYADVNGNGTYDDQTAMINAAIAAGAGGRFRYTDKIIVHADWRPTWWRPSDEGGPPVRDLDNGVDAIHPSSSSDDEDDDDDDGADGGNDEETAPAAPAAPTTSTPPTVACGYSGCALGGRASSRTAHQSTCPRGHVFWTCKRGTGYGNDYHGDRTCVRSGCGETFTRCSNAHRGSNPCRFNRGGWHTD